MIVKTVLKFNGEVKKIDPLEDVLNPNPQEDDQENNEQEEVEEND